MTDLATVRIELTIAVEDRDQLTERVNELLDLIGSPEYVLTVRGVEV